MAAITIWCRLNRGGRFAHHHIEDGHSADAVPKAISQFQKSLWEGATWQKRYAWLSSDWRVI